MFLNKPSASQTIITENKVFLFFNQNTSLHYCVTSHSFRGTWRYAYCRKGMDPTNWVQTLHSEFKPTILRWKIGLVSHPVRGINILLFLMRFFVPLEDYFSTKPIITHQYKGFRIRRLEAVHTARILRKVLEVWGRLALTRYLVAITKHLM